MFVVKAVLVMTVVLVMIVVRVLVVVFVMMVVMVMTYVGDNRGFGVRGVGVYSCVVVVF